MPLSDVVSLGSHSVEEVIAEETPYAKGDWFFAKRIGDLELAKLGEILGLGPYKSVKKGFSLIGEPRPDGPWPMTMPSEFTNAILHTSDDGARSAAEKWAQIEEFDGASPDNLAKYIIDLRGFIQTHPGPFVLMLAL